MEDEDALLQQALAMSMQDAAPPTEPDEVMGGMDAEEYAATQAALQMSMEEAGAASGEAASSTAAAAASPAAPAGEFFDPSFVSQLLGQAPGVDPNDPRILAALGAKPGEEQKEEEKKDEQKDAK